jgi:hypothetical protein
MGLKLSSLLISSLALHDANSRAENRSENGMEECLSTVLLPGVLGDLDDHVEDALGSISVEGDVVEGRNPLTVLLC